MGPSLRGRSPWQSSNVIAKRGKLQAYKSWIATGYALAMTDPFWALISPIRIHQHDNE